MIFRAFSFYVFIYFHVMYFSVYDVSVLLMNHLVTSYVSKIYISLYKTIFVTVQKSKSQLIYTKLQQQIFGNK